MSAMGSFFSLNTTNLHTKMLLFWSQNEGTWSPRNHLEDIHIICLCDFSVDVETNNHKLSSMKQLTLLLTLKFNMGLIGLELRCQQGCVFFWKLPGRIHFFALFQLLEVVLIPWLWATFSTFKASKGSWVLTWYHAKLRAFITSFLILFSSISLFHSKKALLITLSPPR